MLPVITRQKFLKTTGLSLAAASLSSVSFHDAEKEGLVIGLCGGWSKSRLAKQAGCSYIEEGVAKILMPDKSDAEFKKEFETQATGQSLPIECFNVFLPGELKAVGHEANHERILKYASVAFKRAETVGAKIIVFGSGRSRLIPDYFDRGKAKEQFISLCQLLAPLAAMSNVTLGIEQLNQGETNLINTMQESAEVVEAVHHPHLKMICDIYHALRENDPATEIVRYREHLVHCHIAEKKERTPPGASGDDFKPYFSALKKINYKGRISLECNWKNMEEELQVAVRIIQDQYRNA